MKLSIFMEHVLEAARQKGKTTDEVLLLAHSFGFEAVDCDVAHAEGRPEAFAKRLAEHGLCVSSAYQRFDFGHRVDDGEIETCVQAVAAMGSKNLLLIPGFIPEGEKERCDELLAGMLRGTELVCRAAERVGVTVSLEDYDHFTAPFSTIKGLRWFLDRVPALGLSLDTGNFLYSAQSVLDAMDAMQSRIVHVHLKDRSLKPVAGEEPIRAVDGTLLYSSPVGSGCIPMAEVLRRLKGLGYEGFLAAEHFGSLDQLRDMELSARWISAAWNA